MSSTLTVTTSPSKPAKTTLSSNWRQLQKTLKRKSPETSSTVTKTKTTTTTTTEQDTSRPPKRPRREDPNCVQLSKKLKPSKSKMSSSAQTSHPPKPSSASLALWAEDNDISPGSLAAAYGVSTAAISLPSSSSSTSVTQNTKSTEIGHYVAIDCEMVGVGGPEHERSVLARVSIVNFHGHCVLDVFVRPQERVTDWRTWVSGVSPASMKNAVDFVTAQKMVSDVLQGRVLVGHSIKHDLDVLMLGQSHPKRDIRDTSKHADFRKLSKGKTPGLKKLAKEILGIEIQGGEHSSIEDARACMLLYRRYKPDFERLHAVQFPQARTVKKDGPKSKTARLKKRKENKAVAKRKGDGEGEVEDDGGRNLEDLLEI